MTTIETILSRAMSEPDFAELLFSEPEKALADYELSSKELDQLKEFSFAKLNTLPGLSPEERKSLASLTYPNIKFTLSEEYSHD